MAYTLWWGYLGLAPVCLIFAFWAQRLKTNWPGAIAHLLFNGLGFFLVLWWTMGVG